MRANSKAATYAVIVTLVLYVVSYLWLSMNGRFEPEAIGLAGVKLYGWAPLGFVHEYKWNHSLQICFLPLWVLDAKFWHKSDDALIGKYPTDEVSREDIWKVYVAWDLMHRTK